ncbi:multiple sugar transport system permease protein [Symbiobacterium terraclitae]|uniref:Multiple sugar transport system permease protein n=1 Tax=Symbiobacterium terraclitae TaxID=557451 RepID=A0ABS4JS95_9FIRM|nr:sugar ABC transporter permease [Symbiobacterium terraclitae]MBP2018398.1 multiple sugar transport system permease protein [Symbiobacterium terraclitae]
MAAAARPKRARFQWTARAREALTGYLFILPWAIGFVVFIAGPMLFSLYASFTNYNVTSKFDWIGLANYKKMFFNDPFYWKSMGNTLYFTVFSVPINIMVGVVSAVMLFQNVPLQKMWRTIFYLPKVLTGVAVLMLWVWVFNPQDGLMNNLLRSIGVDSPPLWFASPKWSKPALIVMSAWSATGGILLYLAGLQAIPKQLYEAAQIDGASGWRQFLNVTLPMLSSTIFFKLITGINGAMQYWEAALIVTNPPGSPSNSTLFNGLYIWNTAFRDLKMGYASAMAWVMFVITLILAAIQFWGSNRWVYYEGERR